MYEALGAAAFDARPPPTFDMVEQRARAILMDMLPEIANALEDLKLLVLHAPPEVKFITSDHRLLSSITTARGYATRVCSARIVAAWRLRCRCHRMWRSSSMMAMFTARGIWDQDTCGVQPRTSTV